jgi:hypothetical protein
MDDLEQLARLRVAVALMPRDLGEWVLSLVLRRIQSEDRRSRRNDLLLEAAARVDGSLWRKAREVSETIEYFRRYPGIAKAGVMVPGSPAELVQQAWRIDTDLPRFRQVLSILSSAVSAS